MCCYHSFLVHDKRCLVSHWSPASEIGMRLITTSWNSAWWPEEAESGQLVHRLFHDGHAVPWPWEEWHGRWWHGRRMASVYHTRPHDINLMGKTHSKPLAARHGRGTACYVWIGLYILCGEPVFGGLRTLCGDLVFGMLHTLCVRPNARAAKCTTWWHSGRSASYNVWRPSALSDSCPATP